MATKKKVDLANLIFSEKILTTTRFIQEASRKFYQNFVERSMKYYIIFYLFFSHLHDGRQVRFG